MTRELKICLAGAVLCHVLVLYGIHMTPTWPARLLHDAAVDVTLVAAPAAPAPAAPAPPAPPAPTPPKPSPPPPPPEPKPEIKPPEPLPLEPPEPTPQPKPPPAPVTPAKAVSADPPVVAVPAAPATPHAGDNSATQPGPDDTSATGQPDVQARAKYRHNPKPLYPLAARRRQQEGVVVLDVKVSAQGRVTEVTVAQSSGFPLLDEAALTAVRRWEFDPARKGEAAVDSEILVPVRFRLTD